MCVEGVLKIKKCCRKDSYPIVKLAEQKKSRREQDMKDDFRPLDHTGRNLKILSKNYEVFIHSNQLKHDSTPLSSSFKGWKC